MRFGTRPLSHFEATTTEGAPLLRSLQGWESQTCTLWEAICVRTRPQAKSFFPPQPVVVSTEEWLRADRFSTAQCSSNLDRELPILNNAPEYRKQETRRNSLRLKILPVSYCSP